eukprot:CAMPEP_0184481582 /NCGR_PEP_ID=MMETSP0113_2-20130426/3136_1 /TAXON_ID=91329 /ORGANISM="Norrisiella sphaerica, Strain BC52" /LENGTH=252 /DNA_ID=CAMNT_0026860793 /DNA_START=214 /DNA_END=972 /DNA_ORIENTATION=-
MAGAAEEKLSPQDHVDHRTPIYDLGTGTLHYHGGFQSKEVETKKKSRSGGNSQSKERERHTQHGGYFIQPSSHHVTQVVNGLPAAKSPAFRYVQAKGAKVENANKIYYVKGVAHKGDGKTEIVITPHVSSNEDKKKGFLECIFCKEIPQVIYVNSSCNHIGCRKCWLGWCKKYLNNLKCARCGIKTELANVTMLSSYERRKLMTFQAENEKEGKRNHKGLGGPPNLATIEESDLDGDDETINSADNLQQQAS